jgi:hypothetical protein
MESSTFAPRKANQETKAFRLDNIAAGPRRASLRNLVPRPEKSTPHGTLSPPGAMTGSEEARREFDAVVAAECVRNTATLRPSATSSWARKSPWRWAPPEARFGKTTTASNLERFSGISNPRYRASLT